MEKLTQKELRSALVDKAGVSRTEAKDVMEVMIEVMRIALKKGKTVSLPGLCSLTPVDRAARKVNCFGKGQTEMPASKSVKMKLSTRFREELNK